MPTTEILFVAVCGIGTVNSLFLAAYLLVTGKGERGLNRRLAVLILTFSVRVAKAVAILFVAHLHPLFEVLWILALAATGVAALLYARSVVRGPVPGRRLLPALTIPLLSGALLVAVLPLGTMWRVMAAALVVYAASVAAAFYVMRDCWTGAANLLRRWLASLLAFLASVWALYVALILLRIAGPVAEDRFFNVEAVLFSLAVYALVYLELRYGLLARLHQPGGRERIGRDDPMLQRLRHAVEDERLFLDPALSLTSLARTLRLSPQHVSRLINAGIGSSFNDYLNRLRVEEACRILSGPDGRSRKISALADDCGFGSSSVFYAAFRKFTGQRPSEFQKNSIRA
jgi:AraC-like DNA-binding protein